MTDPGELARSALQRIHMAAVRHRDLELHHAADEIVRAAQAKDLDPGPVESYRPCPVCGAEPGQLCINVPGRPPVTPGDMHPERTKKERRSVPDSPYGGRSQAPRSGSMASRPSRTKD
ncbi:zinc finger domain-containing protein [Micromonospora sicca]|uniref:zinc finger domain-containing protein n=2 Tax=Micromonospora sicca TaxID=2202420 RepID=UPI003F6D2C07